MDYQELGRRVRQRRVMMELTQEELAEKAGISCSFVGHIERGEKKFSIGTLVALCNAMEVSPNYLLQDYLDLSILSSGLEAGKNQKAFFDGIMNLLHEHRPWDGEY